jgi:hypothetical protein
MSTRAPIERLIAGLSFFGIRSSGDIEHGHQDGYHTSAVRQIV